MVSWYITNITTSKRYDDNDKFFFIWMYMPYMAKLVFVSTR